MSFDPEDRRALAQQINRETILSRYPKQEGSSGWGDAIMPIDATDSFTVSFSGLPKCSPLQFKTLLTEALKMKQAERERIAKNYWGARGAQYAVKILSTALNFTIDSKGETK